MAKLDDLIGDDNNDEEREEEASEPEETPEPETSDGPNVETTSFEEDEIPEEKFGSDEDDAEGNPVKHEHHDSESRTPDEGDTLIEDFDWQDIQGIGEKGQESIEEFLTEEKGYETIEELVENSFDYSSLPGVGKKKVMTVRDKILDSVDVSQGKLDIDEGYKKPYEEFDQEEQAKAVDKLKRVAYLSDVRDVPFNPDLLDNDEVLGESAETLISMLERRQDINPKDRSAHEESEKKAPKPKETVDEDVKKVSLKKKAKKAKDHFVEKHGEDAYPSGFKFTKDQLEGNSVGYLSEIIEDEAKRLADEEVYESGETEDEKDASEQTAETEKGSTASEDTAEKDVYRPPAGKDEDEALTIVCVNGVAMDRSHERLEQILKDEGFYRQVEQEFDVPYWDGADYNKGGEYLTQLVRERISVFKGRTIYVDARIPGNRRLIPALLSIADVSFRATI